MRRAFCAASCVALVAAGIPPESWAQAERVVAARPALATSAAALSVGSSVESLPLAAIVASPTVQAGAQTLPSPLSVEAAGEGAAIGGSICLSGRAAAAPVASERGPEAAVDEGGGYFDGMKAKGGAIPFPDAVIASFRAGRPRTSLLGRGVPVERGSAAWSASKSGGVRAFRIQRFFADRGVIAALGILAAPGAVALIGSVFGLAPAPRWWGASTLMAFALAYVSYGLIAERYGYPTQEALIGLRYEAAKVRDAGDRRLIERLFGTKDERDRVLTLIASDPATSRRLRGVLLYWFCRAERRQGESRENLIPAVAAGGDEGALEAMSLMIEYARTRAEKNLVTQMFRELDEKFKRLEDLNHLAAAEKTPPATSDLRARAEAAVRSAGADGLSARLRARQISAALVDLDRAGALGDPGAAAILSARLEALLAGQNAAGAALRGPSLGKGVFFPGLGAVGANEADRVDYYRRLTRTAAWVGIVWPAAAALAASPMLAGFVALALVVYAVPLLTLRPPAASEIPNVVERGRAAPARAAVGRALERLGLGPESTPRVGILRDPVAVHQGMRGGLTEEQARRFETHNLKAFGGGLGRAGAIGVGEGLLSEKPELLEAGVAHELGHLHYGDPLALEREKAWQVVSFRATATALFASAFALETAFIAGAGAHVFLTAALIAAFGGGAAATSRLALAAMSRAMEYRANRFAAELVGVEAYRNFLRWIGQWQTSAAQHPLDSHPPVASMSAALGR